MTDLLLSFAQTKGLTDLATYEPAISEAPPTNPTQTLGQAIGIVDIYLRTFYNYQPETTIPALRQIARVANISLYGLPEDENSRNIRSTPNSSFDGSDLDENIGWIIEEDRHYAPTSPIQWPDLAEFEDLSSHGASEDSDGQESIP